MSVFLRHITYPLVRVTLFSETGLMKLFV